MTDRIFFWITAKNVPSGVLTKGSKYPASATRIQSRDTCTVLLNEDVLATIVQVDANGKGGLANISDTKELREEDLKDVPFSVWTDKEYKSFISQFM